MYNIWYTPQEHYPTINVNFESLNVKVAGNSSKKHCNFCNLASPNNHNLGADQILIENENFFAISSIGGFIPGWTLVCPKDHLLNLSRLYTSDDFVKFVVHVQDVVSNEYGTCVTFEHGAIAEGSATSCGVNHAHLHVVPFSGNLESLAEQEDTYLPWQQGVASDIANLSQGQEYLFCSNHFNPSKTTGLFSILNEPRSQFFRKTLAKAVGLSEFHDYKRYRFEEISADASKRLHKRFLVSSAI